MTTALAAHLGRAGATATAHAATAHAAAQASGLVMLTLVILIGTVVGAVARAGRALAALMADFLQVAVAMASIFFAMVISALVIVVLLIHH